MSLIKRPSDIGPHCPHGLLIGGLNHRREPPNAARQRVENGLRDLSRLIAPGCRHFQRQEFALILFAVQREEQHLHVDLPVLDVMNDRAVLDKAPERYRRPLLPRLDGRRLQLRIAVADDAPSRSADRSEEHTSELQSLLRNSYAVLCLKKKNKHSTNSQD